MNLKTAKYISIIGHPLLTIPIGVSISMFATEKFEKALFISGLLVLGIIAPMSIRMYRKSKNGSYTNFDVSDQKQRKSLYYFAMPLLVGVCFILYKTGQSKNLCLGFFLGVVLTVVSQIVNRSIKSSLHVSLNVYLASIIYPLNQFAGLFLLIFTILIGHSRIVLGRHSLKEVLVGAGIGTTISIILKLLEYGLC